MGQWFTSDDPCSGAKHKTEQNAFRPAQAASCRPRAAMISRAATTGGQRTSVGAHAGVALLAPVPVVESAGVARVVALMLACWVSNTEPRCVCVCALVCAEKEVH